MFGCPLFSLNLTVTGMRDKEQQKIFVRRVLWHWPNQLDGQTLKELLMGHRPIVLTHQMKTLFKWHQVRNAHLDMAKGYHHPPYFLFPKRLSNILPATVCSGGLTSDSEITISTMLSSISIAETLSLFF